MEKLRVVFIGGKPLGREVLRALIRFDTVVAIYTNPEDENPKWYQSCKDIADEYNIPYITKNINEDVDNLRKLKPDFIVGHGYDRIIKKEVMELPTYDIINVHTGLIDEYRGCYPTLFPILDGKDHAGITIHQITEEVDNGPVYGAGQVEITSTDTAESLYYKCVGLGATVFRSVWKKIRQLDGEVISPGVVDTGAAKIIHKTDFPDLEIKLSWDGGKIDRYIRALTFNPFPKPYVVIDGKKYEFDYRRRA